jgi:hypothetical protein
MTNKQTGNILIGAGIILAASQLLPTNFIGNLFGRKGVDEYGPAPVNPYAENDDRKTFYSKDGNKENYVKGYDLPTEINKLNPVNGKVMFITLPDVAVFGEKGKAAIEASVNTNTNSIIYNGINLDYSFLKDKLALIDKKYIKA